MTMDIIRSAALFVADRLEHSTVSLCRQWASDLRWYAYHGHGRNNPRHPGLLVIGPIALTRPIHRTLRGVVADVAAAWESARNEVEIRRSYERAGARAGVGLDMTQERRVS